jgi:hypothetical protein
LDIDFDAMVPADERARWLSLPGAVEIRDRAVPIDYDVETDASGVMVGVARLRLPEKMARTLVAEELPGLDRPLRFIVHRGARGSVRASTLAELQDALDAPFTDDEKRRSRDRETPGKGRQHGRRQDVWRGKRRPRRS